MKLLQKFKTFSSKPASERRTLLRGQTQRLVGLFRFQCFPARAMGKTYAAYHPDSNGVFSMHPEISRLFGRWISRNHLNNAGDIPRFYALVLNLKQILEERIPGDFAELGVFRGNSAAVLADFADQHRRRVFLFDTFEGFDSRDFVGVDSNTARNFEDTSLEEVKRNVGHDSVCTYVKGFFPESITPQVREASFSFVHLDCDLYSPMIEGLKFFYPRLAPGGVILLHDYSSGYWAGTKKAVDEFCAATGETIVLLPDKSGSAVLRKRRT